MSLYKSSLNTEMKLTHDHRLVVLLCSLFKSLGLRLF